MQGVTIKNDHPHWFERHHLKSSIAKISHDERFRVGIVMLLVLAILITLFILAARTQTPESTEFYYYPRF